MFRNRSDVFFVRRCDNPECLWSKYELLVEKSEIGDDGFQRVGLIATFRCQCEAVVDLKVNEEMEFVIPDEAEDLECLRDCEV
jgi:hypothetical protein